MYYMKKWFLTLFLLFNLIYSFDLFTNEKICMDAAEGSWLLECKEELLKGCTDPVLTFKDITKHKCYSDDCPAKEEAEKWIKLAEENI